MHTQSLTYTQKTTYTGTLTYTQTNSSWHTTTDIHTVLTDTQILAHTDTEKHRHNHRQTHMHSCTLTLKETQILVTTLKHTDRQLNNCADLFHRNDLWVSSPGCSSLDAKCGALRWLTHAGKHVLLEVRPQCLGQANRGGALTLTKRGRGDSDQRKTERKKGEI